jgi:hypothetical protein
VVIANSDTLVNHIETKTALYFELAGNARAISANYERFLTQKISLRAGIGKAMYYDFSVPVMINYFVGKNNRLELGVGIVYINGRSEDIFPAPVTVRNLFGRDHKKDTLILGTLSTDGWRLFI